MTLESSTIVRNQSLTRAELIEVASRQTEATLLGALIHQPEARALIVGHVSADDFRERGHAEAFAFLMDSKTPTDLVLLASYSAREASIEVHDLITDLSCYETGLPSLQVATAYADEVHLAAVSRRLRDLAELESIASAGEGVQLPTGQKIGGPGWSLHQVSAAFTEVRKGETQSTSEDAWTSLSDAASVALDEVESQERGEGKVLSTGIDALDDVLDGGLFPGDLVVLSGLPSRGKTLVAMSFAGHFSAAHDHPGAVVSLEMKAQALAKRQLASAARVRAASIRRAMLDQDEWERLSGARDDFENHWAPMQICDRSNLDHSDIRALTKPLWARDELDYLIVDYLTLMKETGRSRTEGVGANATGLKGIAVDYDCVVLCLAQMNRDYQKRQGAKAERFDVPRNNDLRDSGQIEQDADVILFVDHDKDTGEGVIHVTKQRNGRIASVRVLFDLEHSTIDDHPEEPAVYLPRNTAPGERRREVKEQLPEGFAWVGEHVIHLDSNRLAWRGDLRAWWSHGPRGALGAPHWVHDDVGPLDACRFFLEGA